MSGYTHRKTRGFVLSLDVLLAFIIVLTILSSTNQMMQDSDLTKTREAVAMSNKANDAMSILLKKGTLETLNQGMLNQELQGIMDSSDNWRLIISQHQPPNFEASFRLETGQATTPPSTSASATRTFIITTNTTDTYYTAQLRVWKTEIQ
ncbi:MAG: hypothetical protein J4432_02525 [DPANN group archaeon]|nr:hypothetical protein [DPANN group archaeon]